MILPLPAFQSAVRRHLGAEVAAACRASDALRDHEAGRVLIAAAAGQEVGADLLPLRQVSVIAVGGATAQLTPLEALHHPLLEDHVAVTFEDQVSAAIVTGARLRRLASDCPALGDLRLAMGEGVMLATATMDFATAHGVATAILYFGPETALPGFVRTLSLSGEALVRIGRESASAPHDPELRQLEPEVVQEPVAVVSPGSGALH